MGAVAFDAGSAVAQWDTSNAPLSDGAAFTLSQEGGEAGRLSFALVQNPPSNAIDLALLLIEKGCSTQLELLSTTLATSRF